MVNLSLVSMGTVVAFLSLVQLFVQPLLNLLTTMAQFIMLKLYLKRINEISPLKFHHLPRGVIGCY